MSKSKFMLPTLAAATVALTTIPAFATDDDLMTLTDLDGISIALLADDDLLSDDYGIALARVYTLNGGYISINDGVTFSEDIVINLDNYIGTTEPIVTGSGTLSSEATVTVVISDELLESIINYGGSVTFNLFGDELDISAATITAEGCDIEIGENGSITLIAAVPEPSMFGILAGLGALGLVVARRRRNRKA
ncbi:MAG: PEP-CTERM sorting domain-containing protein [Opitutae bacterium]|nr:PEP-CTERM sorting domain-containing protein [Opitutae bacterium]